MSSNSDDGAAALIQYLHNYRRISLSEACRIGIGLDDNIGIWVKEGGRWRKFTRAEQTMKHKKYLQSTLPSTLPSTPPSTLPSTQPSTPQGNQIERSACRSIITDFFGLTSWQYEQIRDSFEHADRKTWAGIYRANKGYRAGPEFAMVVELPNYHQEIAAGLISVAVLGAGAYSLRKAITRKGQALQQLATVQDQPVRTNFEKPIAKPIAILSAVPESISSAVPESISAPVVVSESPRAPSAKQKRRVLAKIVSSCPMILFGIMAVALRGIALTSLAQNVVEFSNLMNAPARDVDQINNNTNEYFSIINALPDIPTGLNESEYLKNVEEARQNAVVDMMFSNVSKSGFDGSYCPLTWGSAPIPLATKLPDTDFNHSFVAGGVSNQTLSPLQPASNSPVGANTESKPPANALVARQTRNEGFIDMAAKAWVNYVAENQVIAYIKSILGL